ncbi:MAG: ABC transporter substrate-binding protein [Ilumatobacteraceae bacterium]
MTTHLKIAAAITAITALTLAACSSSPSASNDTAVSQTTQAIAPGVSLTDACPPKIVIQTDWFPEAEHGGAFELMGADYAASKDTGAVVGALTVRGQDTGVELEIRAGGPFLQIPVVTEMYQDDAIMFGYVGTDVAIKTYKNTPTLAVFSALNKNPQVILWNADKHPDAKTIADIGKEISTIYVFGDQSFMRYFVSTGAISEGQIDTNYQGNLLLATEDAAHQGFVTSEPYKYSVLSTGAINTGYELIHDAGWTGYSQSLAIRKDRLEEFRPCLAKLVPIMQQAEIDYIASPQRANAIIIATTLAYDSFWTQSEGDTANGAKSQKDLDIIGNGDTPTFGDFEEPRVTEFIAKALPIFREQGLDVVDVIASDLTTNEFLDPTITYVK